jgi:arylsulfatase A-like enzyme
MAGLYSTELLTTRAVQVIEGHAAAHVDGGTPLFLYLPYQAVHWPLEAPQTYVDAYAGKTGGNHARQMVCAMAKVLDDGVGNVTAALKRVGMWDRTVVVFSSDNGGPTNGNEGTWSSNFPLRGGKNTVWEGGTRVVGAVRGPGIPAGSITYEKHHATDWLPTLVSMAAGKPWTQFIPQNEPPYLAGDGVDNWPMLRAGGAVGTSARNWLLYETHPVGQTGRTHGDAFVLGDLKVIRTAQVCP